MTDCAHAWEERDPGEFERRRKCALCEVVQILVWAIEPPSLWNLMPLPRPSANMHCDGNCGKAWGINNRPNVQLSEDVDDYEYLADDELGEAPENPGTYEGGHGKPPGLPMNKWCYRECERSADTGHALPDFTTRPKNKP